MQICVYRYTCVYIYIYIYTLHAHIDVLIYGRKGETAIATELIKRGARTHLRSQQGRLASDYAREAGDAVHDLVVRDFKDTVYPLF